MKILAVFGLTGALGLVRAFVDDSNRGFVSRVFTPDAKSDQAKESARRGAEVVAAAVDQEKYLRRALDGSYWRMRGVGR